MWRKCKSTVGKLWRTPGSWRILKAKRARHIRTGPFWQTESGGLSGVNSSSIGLIGARLETVLLHFAVERRATDLEPLGDFRHVAAVASERQADHIGFDLI